MKKFTILLSLALLFTINTQSQSWPWVNSIGGTGTDEIEHLATDKYGRVAVAGKFSSTIQPGSTPLTSAGDKDILVARYTSSGSLLWAKGAGGTATDEGLSVCTDDNANIIVTGFFRNTAYFDGNAVYGMDGDEIFIAKYNYQGTLQWVQTAIGPGDDRGKGIACDAAGNIFVTGYYKDSCYFDANLMVSAGVDNVFLAKYSPNGTLLWVLDAGSIDQAWASTVGTDSNGDAWVTGSFEGTANFGNLSITSYGGNDVFLAKATGNGNWVIAVTAGGTDDDFGNGLFVDNNDHIAVTGSFFQTVTFPPSSTATSNGAKDGFIAYYNPVGNCNWVKNFGGTSGDKGIDVACDKKGNIYVTGFVNGQASFNTITQTSSGGDDLFIAKYNAAGQIAYATLAGGSSNDYGKGMAMGGTGDVYVAGYYQGSADFGNTTVTSNGDREAYLANYEDGTPEITLQPLDTNICVNQPLNLTVAATGMQPLFYQWYDQSGMINGAVNSSYSFTPTDPSWSGDYYCMVSNQSGTTNSDTVYIGVYNYPEPDLGPDQSITTDETITLDAGPIYYSYLWSTGEITQTIDVIGSTLAVGEHVFSVTVTNIAGCEGDDSVLVTVFIDGLEELAALYGIEVFPIPAKDYIYYSAGDFPLESYSLSSLDGKLLRESVLRNKSGRISLSGIPGGVYFLNLFGKKGEQAVIKVILTRE